MDIIANDVIDSIVSNLSFVEAQNFQRVANRNRKQAIEELFRTLKYLKVDCLPVNRPAQNQKLALKLLRMCGSSLQRYKFTTIEGGAIPSVFKEKSFAKELALKCPNLIAFGEPDLSVEHFNDRLEYLEAAGPENRIQNFVFNLRLLRRDSLVRLVNLLDNLTCFTWILSNEQQVGWFHENFCNGKQLVKLKQFSFINQLPNEMNKHSKRQLIEFAAVLPRNLEKISFDGGLDPHIDMSKVFEQLIDEQHSLVSISVCSTMLEHSFSHETSLSRQEFLRELLMLKSPIQEISKFTIVNLNLFEKLESLSVCHDLAEIYLINGLENLRHLKWLHKKDTVGTSKELMALKAKISIMSFLKIRGPELQRMAFFHQDAPLDLGHLIKHVTQSCLKLEALQFDAVLIEKSSGLLSEKVLNLCALPLLRAIRVGCLMPKSEAIVKSIKEKIKSRHQGSIYFSAENLLKYEAD